MQTFVIKPPDEDMTLRERALQIWGVHPRDLEAMGFETRIDFYESHLQHAVEQALREDRESGVPSLIKVPAESNFTFRNLSKDAGVPVYEGDVPWSEYWDYPCARWGIFPEDCIEVVI